VAEIFREADPVEASHDGPIVEVDELPLEGMATGEVQDHEGAQRAISQPISTFGTLGLELTVEHLAARLLPQQGAGITTRGA